MNRIQLFFKSEKTAFLLGGVLLATMTGCVGYVDGPRADVGMAPVVVVAQDDYVYYPGYDVYYNSYRHQYAYQDGGAWVSRPAPRGVSVDVLHASPSVRMDFHDSPAQHHAAVVQKYPKNWAPPGANHGQKEDRKEDNHDSHDEHGGNNGR
jgi:hypothetical protein